MPVSCEFRGPALVVTFPPQYTFADLTRAVEDAIGSAEFQPGASLLFDARLSTADLSSDEIRARAWWIDGLRSRGISGRCAFVSGTEPFRFALGRMTAIMLDNLGIEMAVFSDLREAFDWLGGGATGCP